MNIFSSTILFHGKQYGKLKFFLSIDRLCLTFEVNTNIDKLKLKVQLYSDINERNYFLSLTETPCHNQFQVSFTAYLRCCSQKYLHSSAKWSPFSSPGFAPSGLQVPLYSLPLSCIKFQPTLTLADEVMLRHQDNPKKSY